MRDTVQPRTRGGSFTIPLPWKAQPSSMSNGATSRGRGSSSNDHALAPDTPSSSLQTNNMIDATKHRIFEMTFNASGSGSAGKANPNAAQTANTTNIAVTA